MWWQVRKALGSNWAVFSFEWLYFLMKRNRFEGNLDSGVVDMNAYIIELQGTHKFWGTKLAANAPSVQQTPGGNVNPPKFVAIVLYMCPVKALFSKFQKP
ncbi:hypothetical protein NC652_031474 [Populus alba x Populus x berolinensis]|nr:hypothetical protein NC652_031474 [Populus alba x Populus x berolinensis]